MIIFLLSASAGIESFSKLGDSIYFEEEGQSPVLYIIQYISSSLDWKSAQIVIDQRVESIFSADPYLRATLTFSVKVLAYIQNIMLHLKEVPPRKVNLYPLLLKKRETDWGPLLCAIAQRIESFNKS